MRESFEERIQARRMKEKKMKRWIFGGLAVFVAICVLVAGYLVFSDYLLTGKIEEREPEAAATLPNRLNILVMGVDQRVDDVGRSDTLFLVSINPKTHQIYQLSIPRDTMVQIPGHGWDKINHAFAYGGKDLTVKTVEKFLGIRIDHAVEIEFQGFNRIVDAIGGVEIDVEKRMYYEDPWDDQGLVIDLQPGLQRLDGEKAITYVRYRDEEGDIGRIARQQKFMRAVISQVSNPGIITRLPAIITEVSGAVETDLSTLELLSLGRFFKENRETGLQTKMGMVPGEGRFIDGVSYWIPDMDALLDHMEELDGAKPTPQWLKWAEQQKENYLYGIPEGDPEGGYVEESEDKVVPKEDLKKDTKAPLKTTGTTKKPEVEKTKVDTAKKNTGTKKPPITTTPVRPPSGTTNSEAAPKKP